MNFLAQYNLSDIPRFCPWIFNIYSLKNHLQICPLCFQEVYLIDCSLSLISLLFISHEMELCSIKEKRCKNLRERQWLVILGIQGERFLLKCKIGMFNFFKRLTWVENTIMAWKACFCVFWLWEAEKNRLRKDPHRWTLLERCSLSGI